VADATGREAENLHGRAVVNESRIENDERVVGIALDAARPAAAVGEDLADVVDVSTDIDGHPLDEHAALDDHLPAAGAMPGHLWLDVPQLRVARRFLLVVGPRPRRTAAVHLTAVVHAVGVGQ